MTEQTTLTATPDRPAPDGFSALMNYHHLNRPTLDVWTFAVLTSGQAA